jgi:DNA-binding beta-propeller fold protein YncE
VVGLVPTGWYPTGVAASSGGAQWYIVNAKSPVGPSSMWCREPKGVYCDPKTIASAVDTNPYAENGIYALLAKNAHVNQLESAGFLTMPAPVPLELARLTEQVAKNNRFNRPDKDAADERLFSFLRDHIKHVIYIMKENRSYDQVLGDIKEANGDSRLTLFPERITPNHHSIARNFVTLDNLLVSAEGSVNGGYWTFAAQTNDLLEHTDTLSLATFYSGTKGGFPYGVNRHDDITLANAAERRRVDPDYLNDPDILPGTSNVYDVDGPGGEAGAGYIWNAALRRGLSVRDYGVFNRVFLIPVPSSTVSGNAASVRNPGQVLATYSDLLWPDRDMGIPDYVCEREWRREFDVFVKHGAMPSLILMDLQNDHFGAFDRAQYGVNTPETQMADNDYAVGMVLEAVANSPFAKDTLVVTIEDDASDGPDHVSAQRTVALFAGPYVRQHAVVSTRYTTVNVVRTIEEILGIGPINLNDALAVPMSDVFDPEQGAWTYRALVPNVLRSTQLPLPPDSHARIEYPTHSAIYWARAMKGQDFSGPDRIDLATFNRALWRGLKGSDHYPVTRKSKKADD